MGQISGKVEAEPGQRIRHEELESALTEAFGPGIGWGCEWTDGFAELVAIRYEFDDSLKVDPTAVEALLQAHSVPIDELDDKQQAATAAQLEEIKKLDTEYAAESFKSLEARVSRLEALISK